MSPDNEMRVPRLARCDGEGLRRESRPTTTVRANVDNTKTARVHHPGKAGGAAIWMVSWAAIVLARIVARTVWIPPAATGFTTKGT